MNKELYDIQKQLNNLNKKTKNKIIFNPIIEYNNTSNILNNISYPPQLISLEKKFQSICINDTPLYNKLETIYKNNLKYKLLKKGTYIYKAYPGFLGLNQEKIFLDKAPNNRPIWLANKYIPYSFVRNQYVGMCAYIVKKDIYLFDYFNNINIEFLLKVIKDKNLIKHIKLQTSYNLPLKNSIEQFNKFYNYDKLWIYTKSQYFPGSWHYCKTNTNPYFKSPIGAYKGVKTTDTKLFNYIMNNNILHFQGLIRNQIKSILDMNGIFYHEEIIIPAKEFKLKNIVRDIKNPLDWTNWKIKDLKISPIQGLLINKSFNVKGLVQKNRSPNKNFVLFKFYINNVFNFKNIKPGNYFLSYNVHNFDNLNNDINYNNNIKNIIKLLYLYDNRIKWFTFQEVFFINNKIKLLFLNILKKLKYKTIKLVLNGSLKNKVYLLFASKEKYKTKSINLNNKLEIPRNCIFFYNKKIKGCVVHLPIGKRLTFDIKKNEKIKKYNSSLRIDSLKKILNNFSNLDFIIGDFNFDVNDLEVDFLYKNNFIMKTNKTLIII